MSVILAIETSTQACSCALTMSGQVVENFEVIPRQHAAKLLPMINQLLQEHDVSYHQLDAVAYGQGPGSFTGLRIACGVTQGIALGANLPVIPVSTLACQAHQVARQTDQQWALSCLDARIDEIYWGIYSLEAGKVSLIGEEGLCKPEMLPEILPDNPEAFVGIGSGLDYRDRMPAILLEKMSQELPDITPRASAIAELSEGLFEQGMWVSAMDARPVYLRDKVTHN